MQEDFLDRRVECADHTLHALRPCHHATSRVSLAMQDVVPTGCSVGIVSSCAMTCFDNGTSIRLLFVLVVICQTYLKGSRVSSPPRSKCF